MFDRKYLGAWRTRPPAPFFLSAHSLAFGERSGSAPSSLPGTSGSGCRQPDAGMQPRHSGRLAGTQTSLGALMREELLLDGRGEHGPTWP